MSKFTPLDLQSFFNAGREAAGWHPALAAQLTKLPAGRQTFWGVPFLLGPVEGPSWLVLQPGAAGGLVTVPLTQASPGPESASAGGEPGKGVSYLVIAHFCDESHDPQNRQQPADYLPGFVTRPGEHLADYVLEYQDGSERRRPIRRRFEVDEALIMWGQWAFAAQPHVPPVPAPWQGPYPARQWGNYQTGVVDGPTDTDLRYWLYALPNPQPDTPLRSIRLEARAGRVAIAAITLYHGATHPFQHRRLESLRVSTTAPVDVRSAEATVDLGIIARTYAVPAFNPDAWLSAEVQGWGEEPSSEVPTHELLVDITASPEATLSVAGHDVDMGPVYATGASASAGGEVRVEILTPAHTWLHGQIVDAATGRPTPARLHFRSADGRYWPPYGHRHEVNDNWFEDCGGDLKLGSTQYAYVDGQFQAELPVGEVYVEIAKGFEYRPVRQRLTITPGQRELVLPLERPLDWRSQGWVTADTHVHFISPQTAWLEAQAEGVNLVNLLASQWGDLFTNVADLSGDLSGVSHDDTLIWVGTENRQHLLGHMSLLGIKGQPVYPMCAGGPDESYLGDPGWSSLAEWSDRCREREGLVVIPHFPLPFCEVAADIVLGKVDAAEIRYFEPGMDGFNVREWYRFLNLGYRVAAVGGTDKMWAGMPVGGVRTYAQLGDDEFTFANWARAVRAGRTFTTSGPLIGFNVEGRAPGDEIALKAGGTLYAEAWVQSVQPFDELQVIVNGQIAAREPAAPAGRETRLGAQIRLPGSAWVAARCVSHHKVWHGWPINIGAHTSPVYVRCGDDELFSPSEAAYMLTLIDGGLTWLDTLSIPASPEHQARIRAVFESAQASLQGRLAGHGHPQALAKH